jgi:hypothetical protein
MGAPRLCHTRKVKEGRFRTLHGATAALPAIRKQVSGPLFSGTIHLLTFTFQTPAARFGVSPQDVQVAVRYALKVAPIIQAYASQYGPNSIAVNPTSPADRAAISGTTYTDADLARWVDMYAKASGLSAGDAVAIFNPPTGVENTDAPVSQGVLGYHSMSPEGHPYAFVNTLGSGFTLADSANIYAQALSHELAELVVDPRADGSNPESADSCSGNCGPSWSVFFDSNGAYLGGGPNGLPLPNAAFFINAIAQPASVALCPAPEVACVYPPSSPRALLSPSPRRKG